MNESFKIVSKSKISTISSTSGKDDTHAKAFEQEKSVVVDLQVSRSSTQDRDHRAK